MRFEARKHPGQIRRPQARLAHENAFDRDQIELRLEDDAREPHSAAGRPEEVRPFLP